MQEGALSAAKRGSLGEWSTTRIVPVWALLLSAAYVVQFLALCDWFVGGTLPTRWVAGGFTPISRVILFLLAFGGLVLGPMGYYGAVSSSAFFLRPFAAYCALRIVALCAVFAVDLLTLRHCEQYLGSFGANVHYDLVLDMTAKAGHCGLSRFVFLFAFNFDLLVSCYATGHTLKLTRRLHGPMDLTSLLDGY
jgi:hypothetical protein